MIPSWEIIATFGFGAVMAVIIFQAYQRTIKDHAERSERQHNQMVELVQNNTEAMTEVKGAVLQNNQFIMKACNDIQTMDRKVDGMVDFLRRRGEG